VYLYIDGALKAQSSSITGSVKINEYPLRIASSLDVSYNTFFDGIVDEVSIMSIALSAEQILANMNIPLSGEETDLVGYWNFNEGEGNTLTDLSGNGNNGTINGATWSGDAAPVEPPVYGCTDSYAGNFDPDAAADDGSCTDYPQDGNHSLDFGGDAD